MPSPDFLKYRLRLALKNSGSDLIVSWVETDGGTVDGVTGALLGGLQTPVSGVMRAFAVEEPARTVLRQFSEIRAGDLIADVDAEGRIELFDNQPRSGVVALDDLAGKGARFDWGGETYSQADIGEDLARSWNVVVCNVRVGRTLLLRRAT